VEAYMEKALREAKRNHELDRAATRSGGEVVKRFVRSLFEHRPSSTTSSRSLGPACRHRRALGARR